MGVASCIIILDKDDNLLLTRRTKKLSFPGCWVVPGGKIDYN